MRAVYVILGFSLANPALCSLDAQQFDMTQSTRVEFGGALDFIMRITGANQVQSQRTMLSGDLGTIRTDDIEDGRPTSSTLINYATGDMHFIDHEDQSYYTYNFAEMLAQGPLRFGGQADTSQYEAPEEREEGAEYEISVDIDSPGGTKTLLGYSAGRTWVKVTATPTRAPEGVSLDSMPIFIMLTELWSADDFPGNRAMEEIAEDAATYLSTSVDLDGESMGQAFAQYPQFKQAFEENQGELEQLRNMPLEQLSVFVSLSQGAEFNADSALHGSMGEMKIDVAGAVASGVTNAITGGISRRLGGIGRRREPEPPPPPPQAVQILMFRVHEIVESFDSGPLESGWNLVPNGYTLKESPFQPNPQNDR